MQCIAARGQGNGDEPMDIEITLARRRPQAVSLVGFLDVQREAILLGVNRHRLDIRLRAGAHDAHRDFTPVGDQQFLDGHGEDGSTAGLAAALPGDAEKA